MLSTCGTASYFQFPVVWNSDIEACQTAHRRFQVVEGVAPGNGDDFAAKSAHLNGLMYDQCATRFLNQLDNGCIIQWFQGTRINYL